MFNKKQMKVAYDVSEILLIVGGANWALSHFWGLNLVTKIAGTMPVLESIIYGLVGASALYLAWVKFGGK
jgi:uncharacterized membrane protein YuzA (DUF378 family)